MMIREATSERIKYKMNAEMTNTSHVTWPFIDMIFRWSLTIMDNFAYMILDIMKTIFDTV